MKTPQVNPQVSDSFIKVNKVNKVITCSKKTNIFDKEFYSKFYNVKLENCREHYLGIGQKNNYLTNEREFLKTYPEFIYGSANQNNEDKYELMKKYHEEFLKIGRAHV